MADYNHTALGNERASAGRDGVGVGGNVTGLSMMTSDLNSKRLQLLQETSSQLRRITVLWNPDHPFHSKVAEDLKQIAPTLSIELSLAGVRRPEDLDTAFSDMNAAKSEALYVVEDPIFFAHQRRILELASRARLPTIHELRRWPEEGALMSYGPDLHDLFRRSAFYVGKILKGAKPADIQWSNPPSSNLLSISGPPRRWDWTFPIPWSRLPTR
jgi:putative tryptophan/tyrosine transport system substrate-binding protein